MSILAWSHHDWRCTMEPITDRRWRILLTQGNIVVKAETVFARTQQEAARTAADWFTDYLRRHVTPPR